MKLNWNFLGGEGVQNKKPCVCVWGGGGGGGAWIFSGTIRWCMTITFYYCSDGFDVLRDDNLTTP